MVIFDKLVVTNCDKLDIQVTTSGLESYYVDGLVDITKIVIDTNDTLSMSIIPSGNPIYDSSIYTKKRYYAFDTVEDQGIYYYRFESADITYGGIKYYAWKNSLNKVRYTTTLILTTSSPLYELDADSIIPSDDEISSVDDSRFINIWDVTTGGIQSGSDMNNVHIILDSNKLDNIDINSKVFYVWVYVDGTPVPNAPCGYDSEYSLGVVFSGKLIHNNAMNFIKEINGCSIPQGFINFILNYYAMKLSLKAKDYLTLNEIFLRLIEPKSFGFEKGCGCNG